MYRQGSQRIWVPRRAWQVSPPSEVVVLVQAERSRLEGNVRIVGRCGRVVYAFRVLSGMAVMLHLHLQGAGRIRVRTEAGGLAARRIVPSVQSYRLMVRIPFQTAVQSL